jgi:hypothetical protein
LTRKLLALTVVVVSLFGGTSTANAHSSAYNMAKVRYYHADGIVKWIGHHAKVTQYSPNAKKRNHWQKAVKFWKDVRHQAWITMHPEVAVSPIGIPQWLDDDFECIHRYEGAWDANTGNGYYGGLQMDIPFQSKYGSDFMRRWGKANNWPVWAQKVAAVRAYQSGRGFGPWPNTARACGLL